MLHLIESFIDIRQLEVLIVFFPMAGALAAESDRIPPLALLLGALLGVGLGLTAAGAWYLDVLFPPAVQGSKMALYSWLFLLGPAVTVLCLRQAEAAWRRCRARRS